MALTAFGGTAGVVGSETTAIAATSVIDVKTLHAKIGTDICQRFLGRRARQGRTVAEQETMIERSLDLPVARQAGELGISRGSVYYLPRLVPAAGLALMRRIDELHLEYPFASSRMLHDLLAGEGITVGRVNRHADEAHGDRGGRGGSGPLRSDGRLQHEAGFLVHQYRLHEVPALQGDQDQHGRQGRLARKRLRRAALEVRQKGYEPTSSAAIWQPETSPPSSPPIVTVRSSPSSTVTSMP